MLFTVGDQELESDTMVSGCNIVDSGMLYFVDVMLSVTVLWLFVSFIVGVGWYLHPSIGDIC